MRSTRLALVAVVAVALILAGCSAPANVPVTPDSSSTSEAPSSTPRPSEAASDPEESIVGTVVRFTAGSGSVDVTIDVDSPAVRDFLGLLPMVLSFEEFNGREKIADLPRVLNHADTPGSDPENGDLIYFVPWGNIGFYYNTKGIGYSDLTLHLGTYDATAEELARLEGGETTVEIVV